MARCRHQPRCAVMLPPTPQTLPLPPLTPPCCRQRHAVALPPLPQPPRCCHRAAAVALCATATLCAAATAAAPLPPRRRQAAANVALLRCRHRRSSCNGTEAKRCDVGMGVCRLSLQFSVTTWQILDRKTAIVGVRVFAHIPKHTNSDSTWRGYLCYEYKKTNMRIGIGHFPVCIRVFAQEKHLFYKISQNGYAKEQPRTKKASHCLLRIRVSVYRANKNTASHCHFWDLGRYITHMQLWLV